MEPGASARSGSHPDQILEVIDLATEVARERAIVELQAGDLTLELPAAPKNTVESAA